MSEVDPGRAELLGELIRESREAAGRSIDECSDVLGITAEEFRQLEENPEPLTLPQLESLALFLEAPMSRFWGIAEEAHDQQQVDFELYRSLRQRIIGVFLYQARLDADLSKEEVANDLETSVETLTSYEMGQAPVPYFELEKMAQILDVPLAYFTEETHGPLVQYETILRQRQLFEELPPEMKAFVVKPANRSYLETAMRLSELDIDKLRMIAEGILDITF